MSAAAEGAGRGQGASGRAAALGRWCRRGLAGLLLALAPDAAAQQGGVPLSAPALPGLARQPGPPPLSPPGLGLPPGPSPAPTLSPTLPGGAPVPSLPDAAQQEILGRILDAAAGRPPRAAPPLAFPSARPAADQEPLSPAEAFFAARDPGLATPLRQIGHDSFRGGATAGLGFGALPEDYLLGRDDELVLAFRGRVRQQMALRIGRDGMLLVPDLAPIPAAGRTLRALRADLEARAAQDLGGSEVFVSVGQVRQIAIFVGGEVARPGLVALTAHASVLDALVAAGGVRRTGSLRAIRVDGGEAPRGIDLYPVIVGAGGEPPDLRLREGERILVPPLGGVVAIGGEVTRPGIYELPAGAGAAPLSAMLALAGQPLRPSGNRFLLQTSDAGGRRSLAEIGPGQALRRGDLLRVEPGTDAAANQVRVAGHVASGGSAVLRAASGRARTLRGLLADPLLVRPDPYPALGVVWRTDRRSRVRRFIPFDLAAVLRGEADLPLAEGDEVILLGLGEVIWLASPAVQRALRGEPPAGAPAAPAPIAAATIGFAGVAAPEPPLPPATGAEDCPALLQVALAAQSSRQRFAHARAGGFPDIGRPACPALFQDYPTLLPFLLDHSVVLAGEVRLPGLYPILPGARLDAVVAVAGGLTEAADRGAVELAREVPEAGGAVPLGRRVLDLRGPGGFAAQRLQPRDSLRFPRGEAEREVGPITLVGEFVRPGTYEIRRGERLSEVIARAGGLTPQAYPYGAVFSRESVRQRQQEGFQRTARELEQGLTQVAAGQAVVAPRGGGVDLAGAIQAGKALADSLRQARAAGRMVVEANPVVLASRPDLDLLLEPGDLLAMPKRPGEVTVVGAVLNPGSLQHASGWKVADYVRAAGGRQRFADGGRAFAVLPNGQSVPAGQSLFQDGGPPLPPGSVVVVPQDPSPYETWAFLRDLTQVFSQIALSSAALAVVNSTSR